MFAIVVQAKRWIFVHPRPSQELSPRTSPVAVGGLPQHGRRPQRKRIQLALAAHIARADNRCGFAKGQLPPSLQQKQCITYEVPSPGRMMKLQKAAENLLRCKLNKRNSYATSQSCM